MTFGITITNSSSDKSTVIALLEWHYDPLVHGIYVDGTGISSFNISECRSHLVFVSQEPILYRGTICENILLGIDRNNISKEEIAQLCKDANIYDFIISLPSGLNALGAKKGCMLSGGQKTA
jgi:ATP-binding cassette subfamily B (MDR/TAP) protein 1